MLNSYGFGLEMSKGAFIFKRFLYFHLCINDIDAVASLVGKINKSAIEMLEKDVDLCIDNRMQSIR